MPFDTEQTFEKTVKTGDADPAMQRKVVSIVGPTASGKTGLGIAVAKALARKGEQAEIINADAYQMYRGKHIGTAKASLEEQAQVRHHLIDIIEPDDAMSVARFQELAREKIAELQARGVRPILVGGSGLYARAAIDDISFPGTDPQIRMALEEREKTEGAGALFDELTSSPPCKSVSICRVRNWTVASIFAPSRCSKADSSKKWNVSVPSWASPQPKRSVTSRSSTIWTGCVT